MKRGLSGLISKLAGVSFMKNAIFFNVESAVTGGTTRYVGLACFSSNNGANQTNDPSDISNGNPQEAALFPCSGSLKNLYVYVTANNATVGNYVFTVMVNGIATGIVVTIPFANSGLPVLGSDTTHSFPIVAGDLVALQADFSSNDDGGTTFACGIEFDT